MKKNWVFFSCLEISTCPKQNLLAIEAQVENSYVHNGKIVKRK